MQIYNSMSQEKETFITVMRQVGIYTFTGPRCIASSISETRGPSYTDVLGATLSTAASTEVTFVQNFTDIDDRADPPAPTGRASPSGDRRALHRRSTSPTPTTGHPPGTVHRATEHIPQIIASSSGSSTRAWPESRGDVYYRVRAFPSYGCLCGQNLEDLESGARVSVDEVKEDPLDFALWKAQKPGEPAWESPWGMGRPGWHIECSAMSTTYLGETFDIHGGGKDLLFPHHENEIAQTSGATGKPYVRYWMHNGFINIDNEKMSKSKGNFFTVRDIAKEFDLEAVRLFMLSAHYRSPINFSRELIEAAASSLERLYTARDQLAFLLAGAQDRAPDEGERAFMDECARAEEKFVAAMDDDLNTADALAALFELVRAVYRLPQGGVSREAAQLGLDKMKAICGVLGLLMKEEGAIPAEVQALVDERAQARKNKDWKRSDELRDQIKAMGYILEDTKAGQKVRKGGA